MNIPQDLQPGDILLYSTKDIVDDLIEWKTSGSVAHVEVYAGNGQSWASRNGIGVGDSTYPFRSEGLAVVKRPLGKFDITLADGYFQSKLKGLKYGFGDILTDVGINTTLNGIDCSHLATLLLTNSGCPQFDFHYPANQISPRDFLTTMESLVVYTN